MQKSEEQRPLLGLWVHANPHRDVTLPCFSKGGVPLKNVLLQIASATAPGSALDSLTLGQAESLRKTRVEAQLLPNTSQILGRLCPRQLCPAGHPPWHDDSGPWQPLCDSVIPKHPGKPFRAAKNISGGPFPSTVQIKMGVGTLWSLESGEKHVLSGNQQPHLCWSCQLWTAFLIPTHPPCQRQASDLLLSV